MVRTFEQRVTEVFAVFGKYPPFSTIEEYTEWYLSRRAIDLTKDAEKLEQSYRHFTSPFHEVPLEELNDKAVDIISVVDNDIAHLDYWEQLDVDKFLVKGDVIEQKYDMNIYKQGYARAI